MSTTAGNKILPAKSRTPVPIRGRLTERQQKLLNLAREDAAAGRPFPSGRRIQECLGMPATTSPNLICLSLADKGLVRLKDRRPRGGSWEYVWELVESNEL